MDQTPNRLIWERYGDDFFAMVTDIFGRMTYRLIVEAVPGSGWDWMAWRPDEPPEKAVIGKGHTVQQAMRDAELAALCLIVLAARNAHLMTVII
jgi:hypothetical protein